MARRGKVCNNVRARLAREIMERLDPVTAFNYMIGDGSLSLDVLVEKIRKERGAAESTKLHWATAGFELGVLYAQACLTMGGAR